MKFLTQEGPELKAEFRRGCIHKGGVFSVTQELTPWHTSQDQVLKSFQDAYWKLVKIMTLSTNKLEMIKTKQKIRVLREGSKCSRTMNIPK